MPRQIPQGLKKKVKNLIADGVVDRETVKKIKQANVARKIEFEVGDAMQDDFFPQFKTKHWDNEVNFSARLVTKDGAVTEHDGKLAYDDGEQIARFYEVDTSDEDGGFEFDVVFNSRPKSDVTTWTIQHKELDFFYQPALTPEEIADGVERPENVVGSYAVYHKTKRNNKVGDKEYRTGKAFHIYRPYYEDANGERVWGELNIDTKKNEMTVTAPKGWLDTAAYPVVLDPTFGYTSVGASNINSNDRVRTSIATLSEAGDLTSMSVYHDATSNTPNYAYGVYSSNGTIFKGSTNEGTTKYDIAQWITLSFATPLSLTAGDYDLAHWAEVDSFTFNRLYYDTNVSIQNFDFLSAYNYASWPSDVSTGSDRDSQYSIYATYTTSGGGGGRRRIMIT